MKSIGTKVAIMLPTVESWSKLGMNDIVVVLPVDIRKWNKSKEYNRYNYLFTKDRKIDFEKVVISNSGFLVSLFPTDTPSLHSYVKNYCDVHLVRLKHPELEKYPFTIATYVESRNLLDIMTKSRNILEGELSGSFCCIHSSGVSGIWHTAFDIEDPEDNKLVESKKLGKLISEGKGTTKWKVGYRYLTKNERSFIYLGDLTGGWLRSVNGVGFGESIPGTFTCQVEKIDQPIPLVIDITELKKDEADLLLSMKNGYISVFLIAYLEWLIQNNNTSYYWNNHLRTLKKVGHSGIEVEKVFEDDEKDLKGIITDFYTVRYPSHTGNNLLVDRDKLGESNRKRLEDEMKGHIKKYVENRCGSSYYKLDRSIVNDPDKFMAYLISNKPTYRYYGDTIYNILEYLGEVEFKKLLSGCTF